MSQNEHDGVKPVTGAKRKNSSPWVNPRLREIEARGPLSEIEAAVMAAYRRNVRSSARILAAFTKWFEDQQEIDPELKFQGLGFIAELLAIDHGEFFVEEVIAQAESFNRICPTLADLVLFGNPPKSFNAENHSEDFRPEDHVREEREPEASHFMVRMKGQSHSRSNSADSDDGPVLSHPYGFPLKLVE